MRVLLTPKNLQLHKEDMQSAKALTELNLVWHSELQGDDHYDFENPVILFNRNMRRFTDLTPEGSFVDVDTVEAQSPRLELARPPALSEHRTDSFSDTIETRVTPFYALPIYRRSSSSSSSAPARLNVKSGLKKIYGKVKKLFKNNSDKIRQSASLQKLAPHSDHDNVSSA